MFIKLINNGIDMNLKNGRGLTIIETLTNSHPHLFLMKILLEFGADYENVKKKIIEANNKIQLEILIKYNCKFTEEDLKLTDCHIIQEIISQTINSKYKYTEYIKKMQESLKNGKSEEEIKKKFLKINLQIFKEIIE
jgi:hypothetical protein